MTDEDFKPEAAPSTSYQPVSKYTRQLMHSQQHEKPVKPEQNFTIGMSLKDSLAKKIEANHESEAGSLMNSARKPAVEMGSHFPSMPRTREPELPTLSLQGSMMSAGLRQQQEPPADFPDNISVSAVSMAQSERDRPPMPGAALQTSFGPSGPLAAGLAGLRVSPGMQK